MSESSLSLTHDQLYAEIGDFLQGDRTVPNADTLIDNRIDDCIQSGLRTFYAAHQWSFLKRVATLSVSTDTTALPDDFAQLCDDPSYPSSGGSGSVPPTTLSRVKHITDDELRKLRSANGVAGPPLYCSVRTLDATTSSGERFYLAAYPTPDTGYTFTYCYLCLPNKLATGSNYPLGGEIHAETILQACLAVAEQRWDDNASTDHQARYKLLLEQSIALDKGAEAAKGGGAFPFDTLSQGKPISYRQYLMRVSWFMFKKWDPALLTHEQYRAADIAVQSGYRRFLYPPPTAKGEQPHAWSFQKPTATVSLGAGVSLNPLPSDFAALLTDPTYPTNGANPDGTPLRPTKLAILADSQCRAALAANPNYEAAPLYCSIVPTLSDSSAAQVWQLRVYPTPDTSYTVTIQYMTMPPALTIAKPYPIGGELHGETILEAMLACAEQQTATEAAEDVPTASLTAKPVKAQPQLHAGLFLEYLAQSVRIDKLNEATTASSPWPVFPRTHGIGMSYRELLSQAGDFMEFGWDPFIYSAEEFAFSDAIVQEGYRKLCYPRPINPKSPAVYEWTWLRPELQITTIANQADYPMPIWFSHMIGNLSFTTPQVGYSGLTQISLQQIRRLQGDVITTGLPLYYCISPVPGQATEGGISWAMKDQETSTSYNVTLFPTPDQTYTLTGVAKAVPPRLSDANPWPMCGPEHAETLRTAVIMAAEIRHIQVKPPTPFGRGRRVWIPRPSQEEFNEMLRASIAMDAKRKPEHLGRPGSGYRRGGMYGPWDGASWHDPWSAEVTYNGNEFAVG